MKPDHLDFYFDYLSPFGYFAWPRVQSFCEQHDLQLRVHPILLAILLDHWGQLGPAEIPPKREAVFRHCCRYAKLSGVAFTLPKYHPFHPLPALRFSMPEVCGDAQAQVVTAIFNAGWRDGRDIGDIREIVAVLNEAGLDGAGYAEKISLPAVKERLVRENELAIERGVFGVPTSIIGDQLFWGDDQFQYMTLYVEGEDPLDETEIKTLLNRPSAVNRRP